MSNKIQKFFDLINSTQLEKLARESKFVQRSSAKLTGLPFLWMLLYSSLENIGNSLNQLCLLLKMQSDIELTTEGLNKRFSSKSTKFVFNILGHLTQHRLSASEKSMLKGLGDWSNGVHLSDSSGFRLPDAMQAEFAGPGGSVQSQAKIYFEYDLLSHETIDYSIKSGTSNDNTLMRETNFEEGVLYLFDLGFYKKKRLYNIAKELAYFLTRQKRGVNFWLVDTDLHEKILRKSAKGKQEIDTNKGIQMIDLVKYLRMQAGSSRVYRIYLYPPSSKSNVMMYLHIDKLPDYAKQRKAQQRAERYRKSGKPDAAKQQEDKLMDAFNVYVTNADPTKIPVGEARKIYALRWQIELVFKSWKTHFRVDEVNKCSADRFRTMIGIFLIAAWLIAVLAHQADRLIKKQHTNKKNKTADEDKIPEISFFKVCGLITIYWKKLLTNIFTNKEKKVTEITNTIVIELAHYAKKEIKKIKPAA